MTCAPDQDTQYDGTDFAISNQTCPNGQFMRGLDAAGGILCAGFYKRHAFSPAATFVGETLLAQADCDPGDVATGGGVIQGRGNRLLQDIPVGGAPSWRGQMDAGTVGAVVFTQVICADVAP